ncbi:MAG TPA: DHA2 family efflux MFS transporter permease subunit [Coleofasciculaceae cyanobacterium]|jgi:DHA2 family multidrug resistance protein
MTGTRKPSAAGSVRTISQGRQKWAIALTASLGAILEVIDTSIVNVALTDMQGNLGATLSEIGWVVTGYAIANVVLIPLTAWLGDYFGSKKYFIFSLVGFTLASILCGLAANLPMLIISRILQGLAGGGLLAKGQTILFQTFPPEEQGIAQAVFGVGVIAGPAIGPTLGGYLTDTLGWRWIFFINIPFGILAVAMAVLFLPPDRATSKLKSRTVDWWGIALLTVSIGSLQTLLEEGEKEDWFSSVFIIILASTAVIGLVLFIWRELKTSNPAVDLRVLRHRSLAAGSLYSGILGMGLYGALFAVPIFAQSVLHFTAMQTGMLLFPGALASAVMMLVMGKVTSKLDARLLIAGGGVITTLVMFDLAQINPDTGTDALFLPLVWRGVGTVMMFLPLSLATLGPLPKQDVAAGSGFYNLTRQLGGSIGIAVLTTLLAQREAFHRAMLSESVSLYNSATSDRLNLLKGAFQSQGMDAMTAQQQALAVIDRTINMQSAILSFEDIFRVVGIAFLCSLPLLLFLGKGRGGTNSPPAH